MNSKTTLQDFTDFIEIGHGAFGKVFRATYKRNKRKMALKKISKRELQKQQMISQINTEIKISDSVKHDNIIKLYDCFQDDDHIYLVLQLAQNGQLFTKLKKEGRFQQQTVKRMVSDVIAAVEYLHSRNPAIIHRDIKPENILLDKNNKVKLADFGWSNFSNKPRKTYCGTVDYLAPQMIEKSGHDEKLDIWCIGVLVYELLTGKTPFVGKKKEDTKEVLFPNILNVRIEFPDDFPTLAKSFVLGMVKRNPKQRMSIEQIKNHPWLRKNGDITVLSTPPVPINRSSREPQTFEKIDESVEIINDLNKKISQLEEELVLYKLKEKDEKSDAPNTHNDEQNRKLRNQINKLKIAQQMNEKYKKKQEGLWEEMNKKEKELIILKNQLKKMEDLEEALEKASREKQIVQQKYKKLKKQKEKIEERNKELEDEVNENNEKVSTRIKNGEKISVQQAESPQFLSYLQEQIVQLCRKFESSKTILNKVLEKQRVERDKQEQYIRLKTQEKNLRATIKDELRQVYENEKDEILMNARNELLEEEQKWFREREELRSEYESGMSSTQASTSNSDQLEDMKTELKNIRELNSNYEKTIKQQKTLIEDLKEDLKRKK